MKEIKINLINQFKEMNNTKNPFIKLKFKEMEMNL
jgi:hypothetical protein